MLEPVFPSFQFEQLTDMHLHTLKNRLHGIVLVLLLAATCSFTPVIAEDASGARSHEEIVAEITRQRSYIRELDERLADAKGLAREAVDSRLVRARLELLHCIKLTKIYLFVCYFIALTPTVYDSLERQAFLPNFSLINNG